MSQIRGKCFWMVWIYLVYPAGNERFYAEEGWVLFSSLTIYYKSIQHGRILRCPIFLTANG